MLREEKGHYNTWVRKLVENDWECFYRLIRMYPDFYHYLECRLTPRL